MLSTFLDRCHSYSYSQLLYSRLLLCKDIGVQLAAEEVKESVFTVNPIADQLGLVDASGPRAILAVAASIPMPAPAATFQTSGAAIGESSQPAGEGVGLDGMMVDTPSAPNAALVTTSGAGKGANAIVDSGDVSMAAPPTEDNSSCTTNTLLQDRPEAHFYGYLLDACEKLFEGEMDQAMFEENTRFLFGTKVSFRFVSFACSFYPFAIS